MSINNLINWLWFETWWTWQRPPNVPPTLQDLACHYFNLCEATAWFVFATLVLCRWVKFGRSWIEIAYAAAFFFFGLSDIVEAWKLTSWLLWWKVINLVLLLRLRQRVMHRCYPGRRLF